jgi:lipid A 3-O-deacylase
VTGFHCYPCARLYINPNRQANWYLFAGIEGRLVGRDIFLDGNTNVDSPRVDKEPLVADLQFGAAIRFSDMRIAFSQMLRSREFDGQPDNTRLGLINFTLFVE